MENGLKVAICIPYYKKIEALKRLLDTIMRQDFDNYIVIVSDDSDDKAARNLISCLDERFVYYCNKLRLGATKNCNRAIQLAQEYNPTYIKVMHHDDYFIYTQSLQEYVDMLDNTPEAVFAFSGLRLDFEKEKTTQEKFASESQIKDLQRNKYSIITDNFIGNPSAVIVRNLRIMMDEYLTWLVDVDWYLKLMEYKHYFAYTTKQLVSVGFDGNNLTDYCLKDRELQQKEWQYIYLKHSLMQDFSHLGHIIQACIVYYKNGKGYWGEEDYLAILKDFLNDKKKICLWGTGEIGIKGYELLKKKGIFVSCFLDTDMRQWGKMIVDDVVCMRLEEFEEQKRDYLCIVMLNKAKQIRKILTEKGINSIPYIGKYIEIL